MLARPDYPRSLALILVCWVVGCTKAPPGTRMVEKLSPDAVRLKPDAIKNIVLAKVVRADFPDKLSLMGRVSVTEDRTIVIPSRVTGRTEQVFVASGEIVSAGQPLCTLFSADYAVAREEYLQTLKEVQADPKDGESNTLLELSKRKLLALGVSAEDSAKWKTDAATNSPELVSLVVRAPRAGALLGKNAVIGNLVNVGDPLFTLGDLSKVWFAGDIYPEDLPKIHKGQEVVIDQGSGNPACHGKISFVSPQMDPNSRTIKIRALMNNPGGQLRADMYIQGNIILSTRRALLAPKSALVRLDNLTFAFKRTAGDVFKKVAVVVNGESTEQISVKDGLVEGDEIVSQGGLLLEAVLHESSK